MRDAQTSYAEASWYQKLFRTNGNYYEVIKYIDTQFDPLRTLLNQVCRIFSGSITEALIGKMIANKYLFPVLFTVGLVSNCSNAVYKFLFFQRQKGWQSYWPYLVLTLLVAIISTGGLINYICHNFDTQWLVVYNLPLTIWCGTIQLLAECWNLLERYTEYHEARNTLCEVLTSDKEQPSEQQLHKLYKTTRHKIQALRNKYIITLTLVSIMLISWSSNLSRAFFLNLGIPFSLTIAGIGICISLINYYKDIFLNKYLHPNHQAHIAHLTQHITKEHQQPIQEKLINLSNKIVAKKF